MGQPTAGPTPKPAPVVAAPFTPIPKAPATAMLSANPAVGLAIQKANPGLNITGAQIDQALKTGVIPPGLKIPPGLIPTK